MGWAEDDVYRVVLHEFMQLRYTQPVPAGGGVLVDKHVNFK
jgi:hypothetical protein